MLPIGQLPDAANVKAAAANARTLVRRCSAAASCLAASSRWCPLLLGIGAPPGSFFPMALCGGPATMRRCHLHLCHGASAILPRRPGQSLRHSAPASNKPHPAEKSTPVWLAIWRIWAGFANSQHRDAAFTTPNNICAHSFLLPH